MASATGAVTAVVTVETCTPATVSNGGGPGGSTSGASAPAPNVPSPAKRENRLAVACCTAAFHTPAPASACDQVTVPDEKTLAPLGAAYTTPCACTSAP